MMTGLMVAALPLAVVAQSPAVRVYRTENRGEMREVVANRWTSHWTQGACVVDLDAAKRDHDYLGLGVSFPESSCHLLSKLPPEKRREILELIWTKKGANLSVGRIHCGSSDYSMHVYSYDDTPGDEAMRDFSIDEDRACVIPVIKEVQAVNPGLYLFSSPWSPPAWMKDNGNFGGGRVLPKWYGAYANYVVRFIEEYGKEGLPIRAFTVQNEPEAEQNLMSPTCLWTGEEECRVIREHLLPKLGKAGIAARPWLFDHNFESTNRVLGCLADPELRKSISGIAWHPYCGVPEMIEPVHRLYPDIPMTVTEMGPHIDRYRRSMLWWGELVLKSINFGCNGFVSWCMVLDERGQPNISCGFPCAGFVELHSVTGEVTPSEQFKMFRHIGPFVERGAAVLAKPLAPGRSWLGGEQAKRVLCCAFRNPDGSHVVVFANPCRSEDERFSHATVQIRLNGRYLNVQLLSDSLTTVCLKRN